MPRDSKALLPAEIRSRVRDRGRVRADALLGLFASPDPFPDRRGSGFPPPSLLRFPRSFYERPSVRRSRALPNDRVGNSSRSCRDLVRFLTRTCPRHLPMAVLSCRFPDRK